nr:hypothetical protein [Candidatus Levybacteria bacterium]
MTAEQEPREKTEEALPLANWDDDKSLHPKLVWWSKPDGRYQVEVQRIGKGAESGYTGTLFVFDHQENNKRLLGEKVDLSYQARFGPDDQDVSDWRDRAAKFVDEELPRMQ